MKICILIAALAVGYFTNKLVDWWGVDQGIEFIVMLQVINFFNK